MIENLFDVGKRSILSLHSCWWQACSLSRFLHLFLSCIESSMVWALNYHWQVFSSAFEHGWPGFLMLPHLIGNLLLIGIIGVAAEKIQGAARFLVLTLFATLCYWIARRLIGWCTNRSSVFIWSCAPDTSWGSIMHPD